MTMSNIFHLACKTLMLAKQDFWLTAGLLDVSFETGGTPKLPPASAIESLQRAFQSTDLVVRLKLGVNGNLERILREQNPAIPMEFNKQRGSIRPDIQMFSSDGKNTVVEVKAVYCMTVKKFYGRHGNGVGHDRDKLLELRKDPTVANRFQFVFFLEMPNYRYPSGCSYAATWKHHCAREDYFVHARIAQQYQAVRAGIPEQPVWPDNAPLRVPITLPAPAILDGLNRWFTEAFRPDVSSWRFDAATHLAGATVACAIWTY
jgi:hypothetical protein